MDFFDRLALAHNKFRLNSEFLADLARMRVKRAARIGHGFLTHDLLDTQPMLEVVRLDDIQKHQDSPGLLRAPRSIGHRSFAFGSAVHDRQEFPAMTSLTAKALGNHCLSDVACRRNLPPAAPGGKHRFPDPGPARSILQE